MGALKQCSAGNPEAERKNGPTFQVTHGRHRGWVLSNYVLQAILEPSARMDQHFR